MSETKKLARLEKALEGDARESVIDFVPLVDTAGEVMILLKLFRPADALQAMGIRTTSNGHYKQVEREYLPIIAVTNK